MLKRCPHLKLAVPAAALWYWGILVSGRLRLGSSLRMSRLSFRLLVDVFADLHLVFLLGIFVGNFIFNFLLFSCRDKKLIFKSDLSQDQEWTVRAAATPVWRTTWLQCEELLQQLQCEALPYLGSRAGTSEQSGTSSGLDVRRTGHTGTEDLRGTTERESPSDTENNLTVLMDRSVTGCYGYLVWGAEVCDWLKGMGRTSLLLPLWLKTDLDWLILETDWQTDRSENFGKRHLNWV